MTVKAPAGTGKAGHALWADLHTRYEFDAEQAALVLEAVRVADRLDALNALVQRDGVMSPVDTARVHPALVEARQQQMVLARLIASLRLPDEAGKTQQRRGGARGSYSARSAAMSRWHGSADGLGGA